MHVSAESVTCQKRHHVCLRRQLATSRHQHSLQIHRY